MSAPHVAVHLERNARHVINARVVLQTVALAAFCAALIRS